MAKVSRVLRRDLCRRVVPTNYIHARAYARARRVKGSFGESVCSFSSPLNSLWAFRLVIAMCVVITFPGEKIITFRILLLLILYITRHIINDFFSFCFLVTTETNRSHSSWEWDKWSKDGIWDWRKCASVKRGSWPYRPNSPTVTAVQETSFPEVRNNTRNIPKIVSKYYS